MFPPNANIVFGHHFTTIAGLGPIVGPAIGIIWGWLPAFLWVFLGSIFMGAVHDFTTLVVSARNRGRSIGELTGEIISPSTRYALQFIMQLLLFIVLAVFAMIVGSLFVMYPESVIPVWFQIPVAVWLGWQIRRGKNDLLYSIIALLAALCFCDPGCTLSGIPSLGSANLGGGLVHHSFYLCLFCLHHSGSEAVAAPRLHQLPPVAGGHGFS